ncbi:AEC family transporter [Azospirillum brasilense]|uniref:AEC family transporter n=1 Tax=Azospirillum brasilense TaxID=192 RepID=A0A6L3B293_AZOBR|nr:AEC family transporter [Azospirillum brasilense]KAA0686560.1 AEC family transporter [Azospirillum brasilense]
MTLIFQIVLPMFVLVALGFYAGKSGNFSNTAAQGLSRFLGIYALPALLFAAMAKAKIPDPIEWGFVASFFVAAFIIFGLGAAWMLSIRRRDEAAIGGFAPSFSSIGLLGAPILMDAYGSSVAIPVMLLILFQSPLLFTTATMIAEAQRTAGGRPVAAAVNAVKATLLSPMILSIVVGMGFNLTGVHVPDAVMKAADYAAATVLPCACFTLGTALSFGKLSGKFGQALVLAVMKTVLHPVLTWVLAVEVFHLPPDWLAPAVTAAALPIGVNVYAFAERYQTGRELVSMSLLLSTLMSPISISVAFMVAMG